jgi:hypothetical protein
MKMSPCSFFLAHLLHLYAIPLTQPHTCTPSHARIHARTHTHTISLSLTHLINDLDEAHRFLVGLYLVRDHATNAAVILRQHVSQHSHGQVLSLCVRTCVRVCVYACVCVSVRVCGQIVCALELIGTRTCMRAGEHALEHARASERVCSCVNSRTR